MICPFSACLPTARRPFFFFFNVTATTEIYTLSLHDALPIYPSQSSVSLGRRGARLRLYVRMRWVERRWRRSPHPDEPLLPPDAERALATGAAHRLRRAPQRRAVAAAGAYKVLVAPLRGQALRIARTDDDRPVLGRCRNDFQGRTRHGDLLPVDVEPRFSGRQIRHPVPRTTAHSTVHVDLQPSPLRVGRRRPLLESHPQHGKGFRQ